MLIMEETRRLLARQESNLDTLRSRVATILAGASIVAAVFGGLAPKNRSDVQTVFLAAAFVLFALTVLVCVFILWPRGWNFSHSLAKWVNEDEEGAPPDPWKITANLAANFEAFRDSNESKLERLYRWFAWACLFLGLQVLAWAVVVVA
jgi:hypothetical protein